MTWISVRGNWGNDRKGLLRRRRPALLLPHASVAVPARGEGGEAGELPLPRPPADLRELAADGGRPDSGDQGHG
jgi:hypothetical protein